MLLPIGSIPIVHPNIQDPQPEKPSVHRRSRRLRHLDPTDSSSVKSTESSASESDSSDSSTVFVAMRADVQQQPDKQLTNEMSPDNHINESLLSSHHSLPDDSDSSEKSTRSTDPVLGNDILNKSDSSSEKSVFDSKPDTICSSSEVQEKPILRRSDRTRKTSSWLSSGDWVTFKQGKLFQVRNREYIDV